ncbi:hypothetical protein LTR78_005898 [Recurvomyces mirabilis]|uniref:Alcohol dehydrogenase-like N-terminal domain-containing protein n=1 Tax=Recurvomyces mirabilis TaxID=574656 RepID=A0AAE1C0P1_9PEZI|nr:hypothetical protein LTR78_005898 [Recurvomyces mirabilis]KAK5155293.1 hypothetical protein LTS14_006248 [Recurvomyces mirabilis]
MASTLPSEHKALVVQSHGTLNLKVKTIPTAQPTNGAATVRIEAAGVLSYHHDIYNGDRNYSYPTPMVGGLSAIGRIAALGPDAVALKVGQLIYVDCVIHGRDDPDSVFLTAIHEGMTEGSKKMMRDTWRDGYWAEYAKVPLENCIPLNENRLCEELGYAIPDLVYMNCLMVPFGGFRDIDLKPGETVVISPATGAYGGAAVMVAIAMGCRVVAFGRNEIELARIRMHVLGYKPEAAIEILKMTGDEMADAASIKEFGQIDAVVDFSPPQVAQSPHVRSAVWALRRGGRVSLMGFNENPVAPIVTGRNITLKGKLMYDREDMVLFVKMLEAGLFPKGQDFVKTKMYKLEQWREALEEAKTWMGIRKYVVLIP